MDGAAVLLGISRRFLIDAIKDHPHFERRGAKKVFYPEHIAALQIALDITPPASPKEAFFRAILKKAPTNAVVQVQQYLSAERDGTVFIIRCNDRVKIGFTDNLPGRLRVLKTACPYPIDIILTFEGDRKLEYFLHTLFADQRRHGEWFEEIGLLKDTLACVNSGENF
jgi:hypothetical protein